MAKELKVSAGGIGIVTASLGTFGRFIFVASRPGGLHPVEVTANLSDSQFLLGSVSLLLLIAGALLGLFGALKGDGRASGWVAVALSAMMFILMF